MTFAVAGAEPCRLARRALRAQAINVSVSTQFSSRLDLKGRGLVNVICAPPVHVYNTEEPNSTASWLPLDAEASLKEAEADLIEWCVAGIRSAGWPRGRNAMKRKTAFQRRERCGPMSLRAVSLRDRLSGPLGLA